MKGCFSGVSHSSLMFMYLRRKSKQLFYWSHTPAVTVTDFLIRHVTLTCQSQWRGWPWMCAVCLVCIHPHSSLLRGPGWERHTPRRCTCASPLININFNAKAGHRHNTVESVLRHVPLGQAVGLWIELCGDLAKLGENFVYHIFEFLQPLRAHLRDVVHHHDRIYAVGLLGLLPQNVAQKLYERRQRRVKGQGGKHRVLVTIPTAAEPLGSS